MRGIYIILLGICCSSFTSLAIAAEGEEPSSLPRVFILGEHETAYEQLMLQQNTSLLAACDNDMQEAFVKLTSMYREIEAYADQLQFDIKGVRLWIHVFWDKNGMIQHLGYHLRPNSKNIDTSKLTNFLEDFIQQYRFPLTNDTGYSLYTSASFPVRYQPAPSEKQ